MLPVFAGVIVSWFDLMKLFGTNSGWFWSHVVGRLLLSATPGIELAYRSPTPNDVSVKSMLHGFSPGVQLAGLANPELWIGVLVGALFIAAAIWLRQRRDDI